MIGDVRGRAIRCRYGVLQRSTTDLGDGPTGTCDGSRISDTMSLISIGA